MNTIHKLLLAGLFCFAALTAAAQNPVQGNAPQADAVAGATQTAQPQAMPPHQGCMMHGVVPPVEFQSVKICFSPLLGAFVAVDSVECSVHLVRMVDQALDTTASFKTDNTYKRHDLKNILRPVSVSVLGKYVVVLASAVNDSAFVALLDENMNVVARRDFSSPMYAMHFEHGALFVVGRNPYGYDINVLQMRSLEAFEKAPMLSHHYRVAKQAEKIKNSDPVGVGLTAVAVSVVFLALVFISLILQGGGKLMSGVEKNKKSSGSAKAAKPLTSGGSKADDQEVLAAIAAAIHLYNDELHDEEDTVLTIQKVEREWTPWNAKFYNMNQYFNNVRR